MYKITMEKNLISSKEVQRLLNKTYWAETRTLEVAEKSMKYSDCIGCFDGEQLTGFARIVTDYSTFFWLCDVIVGEKYLGQGLGKKIMTYIQNLDYYKPLKGVLATKDAHGLYEQYGFEKEPTKFMSKSRDI